MIPISSQVIILLLIICFGTCYSRMQPAENIFSANDTDKALLPNIRTTLNDCHLRYHKYGEFNLVYPVHGVPAKSKEFAHMAAIGFRQSDGAISWDCGGSLITENHVLSAAHCSISPDTDLPPEVARLGDIDLTRTDDDEFVQQFRIVEIKRHPDHTFRLRYNDIALFRLSSSVKFSDAVAPACLWIDNNVDFNKLEAIGFGLTEFGGEKTPNLLKVTLAPITNENCATFYAKGTRRLDRGIVDTQMCAQDDKMDTCGGDSGGALQIKLMSDLRMTPYVVGITSFGSGCGSPQPSVYTRVSSFITWIEQEVNQSFNPSQCALRYAKFREYEPAMVNAKFEESLFIEPERSFMDLETTTKHRVYIGWTKPNRKIQWNCGGTLINEDYVLTAAHCMNFIMNKAADMVKVGDLDIFNDNPGSQIIRIERFILHPQYQRNSIENDIALVKLSSNVRFDKNVVPACLVNNEEIKIPDFEMAGLGPHNLNQFFTDPNTDLRNSVLSLTRMRLGRLDMSSCANKFNLKSFQTDKLLCAGNDQFLVPNTCRIEHGGPLEREIWHFDRYFSYVFGVTTTGDNCGFGTPALFVKVSAHIEWIESIVLSKRRIQKRQSMYFIDDSLKLGDTCRSSTGRTGKCVATRMCPSVIADIRKKNVQVTFCSSVEVACCTQEPNNYGGQTSALNKCISSVKSFSRPMPDFYRNIPSEGRSVLPGEYGNIVKIGWRKNGRYEWNCAGTLITDSFVLTSASCLSSQGLQNLPSTVRLGGESQESTILRVNIHPNYNAGNRGNDIGLIELSIKAVFNEKVLPACLWTNLDNVPLKLQSIGAEDVGIMNKIFVRPRSAIYNEDCRKSYNSISDNVMCAENYFLVGDACKDNTGDSLQMNVATNGFKIPFVVGIHAYTERCTSKNAAVYTRISSHVDWIKSIVDRR